MGGTPATRGSPRFRAPHLPPRRTPPPASTAAAPLGSPLASTAAPPLDSPLSSTRTLHSPPHIGPPRRRRSLRSASSRGSRRMSAPSPRWPAPACEASPDGHRDPLRRTDGKKSPLSSTYLTWENVRV